MRVVMVEIINNLECAHSLCLPAFVQDILDSLLQNVTDLVCHSYYIYLQLVEVEILFQTIKS